MMESLLMGGGACVAGCTGLAIAMVIVQALNKDRVVSKRQIIWTFGTFIGTTLVSSFVAGAGISLLFIAATGDPQTFGVPFLVLSFASLGAGFVAGAASGFAWYLSDDDGMVKDRAEARISIQKPDAIAMAY